MGKRRYNPPTVLKRLGLRIRELRTSKGWTLEDCEELGYPSWRHLGLVEAGKKNVTIYTLANLANLFGVHLSDLFEEI